MNTIELIGEGTYRRCFATQNPDLCIKIMKPRIRKRYFGFDIDFDMSRYLRMKFGITDLNKTEFTQLSNLPDKLHPYLPSVFELNGKGLIMERPRDYDGEYSKSLIETGKLNNEYFWTCIGEICSVFEDNQLWFNDVFFKGNNILVKKLSKERFVPIMIDLKEIGRNLSPLQINLLLKSEQKKKFYRRFSRFEEMFHHRIKSD